MPVHHDTNPEDSEKATFIAIHKVAKKYGYTVRYGKYSNGMPWFDFNGPDDPEKYNAMVYEVETILHRAKAEIKEDITIQ